MSWKVRSIINNLHLQAGSEYYDAICNVADKKQLYSWSKTAIKCYIFGNIIISMDTININPKTIIFWWYKNNIKLNSLNASKYKYTSIINNNIFKCDSNCLWII